MRYSVINKTGKIVNIIEIESISDYVTYHRLIEAPDDLVFSDKSYYNFETEEYYEKSLAECTKDFDSRTADVIFRMLEHFGDLDYPEEITDWMEEYIRSKESE